MRPVELLAPAGNSAGLHAALSAGADAVYLGLESFNARRGADNFTLETLGEACAYAHLRAARVYVTLNTLVLPDEMPQVCDYACAAYRAGADAFIVQDIGLASVLHHRLAGVRLHISTQMNIHDEAGIRAAAHLGAQRVTLARELSVDEIAHLAFVAADYGMEVEVFVHGALCVCYSGQCLMSSMIGGRSANRGMCAQACRLPYVLRNCDSSDELFSPGKHLLSPQDLCAIDLLGELADAGVASLKIEGRMKSPEYVASVTRAYRDALDRINHGDSPASEYARDEMAAVFSRGFTTAYLEGRRGNDIMSYQRPNNRGQFIGRVREVKDGQALVASSYRILPGDIIEFWTKRGHSTLTVRDAVSSDDDLVAVALDDCHPIPFAGDRVFRVRSTEAAFVYDEQDPRIFIVGTVRARLHCPLSMEFRCALPDELDSVDDEKDTSVARLIAHRLEKRYRGAPPQVYVEGETVQSARTKTVTVEEISAHVGRLGSTPFALAHLDVELDDGVGISFSRIHATRARATEELITMLLSDTTSRTPAHISFPVRKNTSRTQRDTPLVCALVTNPLCARGALEAGCDAIYVPALNSIPGTFCLAGRAVDRIDETTYPESSRIIIPHIDHDAYGFAREVFCDISVWDLLEEQNAPGVPFVAESLSGMQRAYEAGLPFEVGSKLPVTNPIAVDVVADFGAGRVWLSPELTLSQIKNLASGSDVSLGITVAGAQELMVTEHCLLMSQGACDEQCKTCARRRSRHVLKDRLGFEFPVVSDVFGRSHVYNSVVLDTVAAIPDLLEASVTAFMVDTTLFDVDRTRQTIRRVIRALDAAYKGVAVPEKLPHTTSGHLYRGVS